MARGAFQEMLLKEIEKMVQAEFKKEAYDLAVVCFEKIKRELHEEIDKSGKAMK